MVKDDTQHRAPGPLPYGLALELRRGVLVLAALSRLRKDEYGYSLKRDLSERGLEIDEGTLYPLLRRLETQGLLTSKWVLEGGRPRRYYVVSAQGRQVQKALAADWRALSKAMEVVLE